MSRANKAYPWERVWISVPGRTHLDEQGFYQPMLNWSSGDHTVGHLASYRQFRCLLLTGPTGSGKSTSLRREQERARSAGELVHTIALDAVSSLEALRGEVSRLEGLGDMLLFVDAVDEGVIPTQSVLAELGRLAESLDAKPHRTCRLRLVVRSGIPCASLRGQLSRVYGASFRELTLAPLSRSQVEDAVRAENLDPQPFMFSVEVFGAGPLAAQPVTLGMLIDQWRSSGSLPPSRSALYETACVGLLSQTSEGTSTALGGQLDRSERIAIAERVAALMVFGRKVTLDLFPTPGWTAEPQSLSVADATGSETDGQGTFRVNEAALRTVASTSLFVPVGHERQAFAHRSFADFLAARYVVRRLSRPQSTSLLRTGHLGRGPAISDALLDVASWMAVCDEHWFSYLLDLAPSSLLRSGVLNASPDARAKLAHALLRAAHDGVDLDLDAWARNQDLVLVSHDGIGDLLRPILQDRSAPTKQRELALLMAWQCSPRGIDGELVALALDPSQGEFRASTLSALHHFKDVHVRTPLVAMALHGAERDPEQELRGLALSLVWPSHLRAGQMIAALSPKRTARPFGSYDRFIQSMIPQRLEDEDLPEALRALSSRIARRIRRRHHLRPFVLLLQGILKRALSLLDAEAIRRAVAELILRMPEAPEWASWSDSLARRGPPVGFDDEPRRRLLLDLVELGGFGGVRKLLEVPYLLRDNDLPWLISRFQEAEDPDRQQVLATLAIELAKHPMVSAFMSLQHFGASRPTAFAMIGASRDPPAYDRWRDVEREEESGENDGGVTVEQLVPSIRDHLDGDPERAWALVVHDLALRPIDDEHSTLVDFEGVRIDSVEGLPGFLHLPNSEVARFPGVASAYLESTDPDANPLDGWWSNCGDITFRAAAGALAMSELLVKRPLVLEELQGAVWTKWAPAIVAYPWADKARGSRFERLLTILARRSPEACRDSVLHVARHRAEETTAISSRALLGVVGEGWVPPIQSLFTAIVDAGPGPEPDDYAIAILVLLSREVRRGHEMIVRSLDGPLSDVRVRDEAAAVAALIWDWELYWSRLSAVQDKAVVSRIIGGAAACATSDLALIAVDGTRLRRSLVGLFQVVAGGSAPASSAPGASDRDGTLGPISRKLAELGQPGRVSLSRLSAEFPGERSLTGADAVATVGGEQEDRRFLPTPQEILAMTGSAEVRLLKDGADLLDLVMESLSRLQAMWRSETPLARMLWNERGPKEDRKWRNKDENFLSDVIKQHLTHDLRNMGLIANREVEIRATGGTLSGERTDIKVEAVLSNPLRPKENVIATLIIEVKGCWYPDFIAKMEEQLRNRYMESVAGSEGLYVVGWFVCDAWIDPKVQGRRPGPGDTLEEIVRRLDEEATRLSARGRRVAALVLDARP